MLRKALNDVFIEGILSEMDIKKGSYVKNGKTIETIGGTVKIHVDQTIDNNPVTCEIPVSLFSEKYKGNGEENGIYKSIETMSNDLVSIAAAGSVEGADRVRVYASNPTTFSNGNIRMNEYYNANGKLVSFPRIHAAFINKLKKDELFKPNATFNIEFAIAAMDYDVDNEGNPTDKYFIKGIVPQYGGKVDIIDFYTYNPKVIEAITSNWQKKDTVRAKGRLNFSAKTETYIEDLGFGEPEEKYRTINVSELIITGGSPVPLDGEFAFSEEEIQQALVARKASLDEAKQKAANGAKVRKAPVPASTSQGYGDDLGF